MRSIMYVSPVSSVTSRNPPFESGPLGLLQGEETCTSSKRIRQAGGPLSGNASATAQQITPRGGGGALSGVTTGRGELGATDMSWWRVSRPRYPTQAGLNQIGQKNPQITTSSGLGACQSGKNGLMRVRSGNPPHVRGLGHRCKGVTDIWAAS